MPHTRTNTHTQRQKQEWTWNMECNDYFLIFQWIKILIVKPFIKLEFSDYLLHPHFVKV